MFYMCYIISDQLATFYCYIFTVVFLKLV